MGHIQAWHRDLGVESCDPRHVGLPEVLLRALNRIRARRLYKVRMVDAFDHEGVDFKLPQCRVTTPQVLGLAGSFGQVPLMHAGQYRRTQGQ